MSNLPVQVNRNGKTRVIQIRREANEEMMQDSLRKRGFIRMRVAIQLGDGKGKYWGYQGSACFRDVRSIKEAREFEKRLKVFVKRLKVFVEG